MPETSEEQSWWTELLNGGADPAWEVPEQTWDSALAAALDPDTQAPDEALIPSDDDDSPPDLTAGEPSDVYDTPTHDDLGADPHHQDWINDGAEHNGDLDELE